METAVATTTLSTGLDAGTSSLALIGLLLILPR